MGRGVRRGEIWLTQVGGKTRPVLILTRSRVINVRKLITVAELTTSVRGLHTEVELDYGQVGLQRPSVVNCDGLHTVMKSSLSRRLGMLSAVTMGRVCQALRYALNC